MLTKILWLALGGALGTLARAGLSAAVQRAAGASFPWGTLTVNVLGCLLFGWVWAWTEARAQLPAELRLVVLTGFMGAFTTFSTYVFDTGQMLGAGRWAAAAGHLALQNGIGLLCLFVGLSLGQRA